MLAAPGPAPDDGVVVLADVASSLGEGPTWDAATEHVRWVDIDAGTLWEAHLDSGTLDRPRAALRLGPTLGAAVHSTDGGILLARSRHLEHRSRTGEVLGTLRLVPQGVASRLNDGACDPAGRYLVGSLALDDRAGVERLWQVDHDGSVRLLDDDLTLSNGLGWSPDGATLYQVDTLRGTVFRREYDPDSGRSGNRHVLVDLAGEHPDGLTVDTEGNLWIAIWAAGQVRCYSPAGNPLAVVVTGAPLTTSCAFVGPDLDLLAITTAGKAAADVVQTTRGGQLLGVRPGARGSITVAWRPAPLPGPAAL